MKKVFHSQVPKHIWQAIIGKHTTIGDVIFVFTEFKYEKLVSRNKFQTLVHKHLTQKS
jgi:hypothetical protein